MLDNGQANETEEVQQPKAQEPVNALKSKIIRETAGIIRTLLENGGKLSKELQAFCDTEEILLPGMADAYGFLMDRLDAETAFWMGWPHRNDGLADEMAFSLKEMRRALVRRIETSMKKISLKELKGREYVWAFDDQGFFDCGVYRPPVEEKQQ